MYITFNENDATKDRLVAVHPYRTARIMRPLIRMEEHESPNEAQSIVSRWLLIAREKGLINSTFGTNHIVLEFADGILVSYSDFRITVGTGLLLENW